MKSDVSFVGQLGTGTVPQIHKASIVTVMVQTSVSGVDQQASGIAQSARTRCMRSDLL
jgi:hypothetical protein